MKRILKIVGLVVGVLVLGAVAVLAPAFLGRRAIIDGLEFNGIHIVKDGFVNVAVVPIGPHEVALIDAGNDKSGRAILAELSRRQLNPDAVTAILVTHGHPDHIGALALFPKAQVMALEPEVALVERGGAKVNRALKDGETVTLGQTPVRVFAVPGHTVGSAAYLVNGILFLGDAADVATDGKIKGSPWIFSASQAQDRASLVALNQRLVKDGAAVKAIAFAHSGVLSEGLTPLTAFADKNQ